MAWARRAFPWRHWLVEHLPQRFRREALAFRQATHLIDWSRTRAYRVPLQYPAEGIEINVRGRQPQGVVEPGAEYERLREEIIAALRELRDPATGRAVVREVWRREEVYPTGDLDAVPDIVCLLEEGIDAGSDLQRVFTDVPLADLERLNGDHTMEGIAILWGAGVRAGHRLALHLLDLPPTLLWAMGLPVPEDMDGRVLTEAFTPEYVAAHPVTYTREMGWTARAGRTALTPEEEAEIQKALVGLGYLEE